MLIDRKEKAAAAAPPPDYCNVWEVWKDVLELFRPQPETTVAAAAEANIMLAMPGGYYGPWDSTVTPYMIEPMNMLASAHHEAVIFSAPAQTGKTQALVDGWFAHNLKVSQSDMMIVQTSMDTARDYSKRRIDRLLRHSPNLRAELTSAKSGDNIYDKIFKSGLMLSIGWPSVNQLSGKPIKYMALTDLDRMPADVDGEGAPFQLAQKRATTFMSGGMTMAESSPGGVVLDPKWIPLSAHEAPPTRGILALYNRGDRRRWYWPCPDCGEYFESGPGLTKVWIPETGSVNQRAAAARLICTCCGTHIEPAAKKQMNARGVWVPDGCTVDVDGVIHGTPPKSAIASYWLHGTAAAFQSLESIVMRYLQAEREFETTGSEESLKTTTNVDQGAAYMPRRSVMERKSEPLLERRENWPRRSVPRGVRVLTAAVDVQQNRFVVQVWGWGAHLEQWAVDRFDLKFSPRGKDILVEPATYAEDWTVIERYVIDRRYPLADDSGRDMGVLITGCDSGGAPGVTDRAYGFYKALRARGNHRRFLLLKGGSSGTGANARVKLTWPEQTSQRQANKMRAKGATPLLMINTDSIKDTCYADLGREQPGAGFVHFPTFLGAEFFAELTAEEKDVKGRWINPGGRRNESWDLMIYNRALAIHRGVEKVTWDNPLQGWALPWDSNAEVRAIEPGAGEGDLFMPTRADPQPPPAAAPPQAPPQTMPAPRRSRWVSSSGGSWL